jgi:hypothetical protein
MKLAAWMLLLFVGSSSMGCGTLLGWGAVPLHGGPSESPDSKVFIGVRVDVSVLTKCIERQSQREPSAGLIAASVPLTFDIPISLAADVILLPAALLIEIVRSKSRGPAHDHPPPAPPPAPASGRRCPISAGC